MLESFGAIDHRFFKNVLKRSLGEPITIADTKRLIIRELSTDDVKKIYNIYSDPEVRRYIPDIDDYLDVEMEKQAAYIRNVYSFYGYGIWGVYSKTSKKLIGKCGIENQMIDGKGLHSPIFLTANTGDMGMQLSAEKQFLNMPNHSLISNALLL